ncbi:hypothetical protein GLYMA_01G015200v4 [Glycine max]|uniref:inactive poly [ADP-ribose] polymerase RCD1 n=1 Tax=Glycine max TaxID=3847 RepID=UPI000294B8D0|nr:inactive poly [ADP-ribose] polymerase RCD1-like [Glycine max]KAG4403019.1 hypothetical protein GLYMA_01G015200v4 [Glycine max]KAH1161136.1 hypothetical protein GYH30_000152 [Glycine max]
MLGSRTGDIILIPAPPHPTRLSCHLLLNFCYEVVSKTAQLLGVYFKGLSVRIGIAKYSGCYGLHHCHRSFFETAQGLGFYLTSAPELLYLRVLIDIGLGDRNGSKIAKELNRVALNLKRKQATRYAAHLSGASQPMLGHWSSLTSPASRAVKRMRLGGYRNRLTNAGRHIGRSLARRFLNYKKSGRLERLMFYENGEWLDFPKDVVDLVKKDLEVKKAAVEIESNGYHLLFDFLHLHKVDLKTGLQQPIALIDAAGWCFSPEIYAASDEEPYNLSKQECGRSPDSYASNEIKLHLEVDINGVDQSRLSECSGESNALVKGIQIDTKQNCCQYDVEVEDSINKKDCGNVGEDIQQHQDIDLDAYTESVYGILDLNSVQKMFLKGMSSFGSTDSDIFEIYQCSGASMQARWELFQKQAEISKKNHGEANIQYDWLASSKGELSTMMNYGLSHYGLSGSKCTYDIGVHLAAVTCPDARFLTFKW